MEKQKRLSYFDLIEKGGYVGKMWCREVWRLNDELYFYLSGADIVRKMTKEEIKIFGKKTLRLCQD